MKLLQKKLINLLSDGAYTPSEETKQHLISNHGSVAKKVVSVLAAGVLSFGLVACAPQAGQNTTDPNPNTGIVTPDPDNNQYSSVMEEVLSGSAYQQLIQKKLNGTITTNELSPIPYHFLSSRGHDIAKIKSDELSCEVDSYTKGSNNTTLYLSVKVENPDSSITNYLLTYSITEQEFEEYKMLHKGRYIQTPFYIQELDNQKTAKLVSAISINKQSYDKLTNVVETAYYKAFKISTIEIDLTDFVSATDFSVLSREKQSSSQDVLTIKQRKIDFHFYPAASATLVNNVVQISNADACTTTNNDEILNSYENLTYFAPYPFTVNNIYSK